MNRRPQEPKAGRPVTRVSMTSLPSENPLAMRLKAAAKKAKPAETDAQRYRRMMGSEADIVDRANRAQARETAASKVIRSSGTGYGSTRKPR